MSEDDDFSYKLATVRAELAWIAFELAVVKWFRATVKAGFNPDQPRVPAGRPDGGRWTRDGGAGGQTELVQARPDRRYSVNLLESKKESTAPTPSGITLQRARSFCGGGLPRANVSAFLSMLASIVQARSQRSKWRTSW